MKLSEMLDRYYVMPFGTTALVGFHHGPHYIEVSWTDPEDNAEHHMEFLDQEVTPFTMMGSFAVYTESGVAVAFIALEAADLGGAVMGEDDLLQELNEEVE